MEVERERREERGENSPGASMHRVGCGVEGAWPVGETSGITPSQGHLCILPKEGLLLGPLEGRVHVIRCGS